MHGIVHYSFTIVASFCVAVLAGERAFGQVLKGEAAHGRLYDDRPGLRRLLTPQDLPPIAKPTYGMAQIVPTPTGAPPQVPDASSVERVTSALCREAPNEGDNFLHDYKGSALEVSNDGSLIVTEGGHGTIWRVAPHETAQGTHNADTGRDLYIANCSACHQASGEGLPGVMPPLKGSGVVNKEDAGKHIKIVLNGMEGARAGGVVYAAVMPPFAGALSDAEIADIINYERRSWGNHGTPVTAAQVAGERARPK